MLLDITLGLKEGMRVYPGDPPFRMHSILDPARGDPARVASLSLGTHTGTHVDAPSHLRGKRGGVDSLPLAALIGPALVVQAPRGPIGPNDVERLPRRWPPRLIFKGKRTLSPEAAKLLALKGALLVGTDGFSIDDEADPDLPAHRALLSAGVVVVERLSLTHVRPGRYGLIVLPLLIPGADGAPARAVLSTGPVPSRLSGRSKPARPRRRRSGTRRRA